MRVAQLAVVIVLLFASVAFAQEDKYKYVTKAHLNKVAPEIKSTSYLRANSSVDLTLESLRGRLVLLLFTSTG